MNTKQDVIQEIQSNSYRVGYVVGNHWQDMYQQFRTPELVQRGHVRTWCRKCHTPHVISFLREDGTILDDDRARKVFAKWNREAIECPGGRHVELGGWDMLWDMEEAYRIAVAAENVGVVA